MSISSWNGSDESLRVLCLSPYHGGSHRQFLEGWQAHSRHRFSNEELPGRHFKWRMRQAAVGLAEKCSLRSQLGETFDVVFTTSLGGAAELRGLLPANYRNLPLVVYFHENQLAYPSRTSERDQAQGWDVNLPLSNWQSCLAADEVWFNSAFNRDTLLSGLEELLRKMPDYRSLDTVERIFVKSRVLSPGIETIEPPQAKSWQGKKGRPLRIAWVARWEHDKDPETFFLALENLKQLGLSFELSVLGQQFRSHPVAFALAERTFSKELVHFGYLQDRDDYEKALREADVVVSTAKHEFFGLALLEATQSGCFPLLPDALVYPEIYPATCLYDAQAQAEHLTARLIELGRHKEQQGTLEELYDKAQLRDLAQSYTWPLRAKILDDALNRL